MERVRGAVGAEDAELQDVVPPVGVRAPRAAAPAVREVAEPHAAVEGVVPRVGDAVAVVAQAVAVLPVDCAVAVAGSCVAVRQASAALRCCAVVPAVPGVRCY